MPSFHLDAFDAYTVALIVFFVGKHLNTRINLLRTYNIPEPVTGGLIATLCTWVLFQSGIEISFDMTERDLLLVYFFTAIGLNARFSDLLSGGRPLFTLLGLTISFMLLQNVVGVSGATLLGMNPELGLLAGTASLVGGHGTAIAWAPEFVEQGVNGAMEIGVASATLGLVIASVIGGPIAQFLITRNNLKSTEGDASEGIVSLAKEDEVGTVEYTSLMAVVLTLHIAIMGGWYLNQLLTMQGFKLPLFVTCLLSGIVLSNTVPKIFPKLYWPARTKSLAIISDFSLGLFLTMSLMSMQLWTIAELAGPLIVILLLQTVAAIGFILWILFRLMGGNYQAAVLSAGFGGFAMGATPTAIANMTAVTKAHGQAPLAFIILPLVAAFFVDVSNSFILKFGLEVLR